MATTMRMERGWGFTCMVQIRLGRIDPFHTLQPCSKFRCSSTCDTSAASVLNRALQTKIVWRSFMALRMLTLATCFEMLLLGSLQC